MTGAAVQVATFAALGHWGLGPGPHSFHARQVIGELGLFLVSMAFLILSFASSLSALEHGSWAFSGLPRAALSLWELSLGMISSKQLHSLGDGGYHWGIQVQQSWAYVIGISSGNGSADLINVNVWVASASEDIC